MQVGLIGAGNMASAMARGWGQPVLATDSGSGRAQALADELGGLGASWTDPQGGFFLWLELPPDIDTEELFPTALEEGVAYIPGPAFSIGGRFSNALRLAFSAEPPERARVGVRRLARAIARQLG
jgi:2-aminoadipate transaminase